MPTKKPPKARSARVVATTASTTIAAARHCLGRYGVTLTKAHTTPKSGLAVVEVVTTSYTARYTGRPSQRLVDMLNHVMSAAERGEFAL